MLSADGNEVAATAGHAGAEVVVCENWREGIAAWLPAEMDVLAPRDLLAGANVREVKCGHLWRPDDVDTSGADQAAAVRMEAIG